ncbi:ead/Ea22-like family protein [Salmonella enterica]|nr:ead/Ea22-like family protein [Salmonella enterica]
MSNIDKQALREEFRLMQAHYSDPADRARQVIYIAAEALLDELDKKQQYIKLRDQENKDIALTVGKLRVELEHYKSREERVTKLVLDNSTSRDVLYEKLEAAEKRIAEQREYYEGVIADGSKRIAELESNEVREVGNQFLVVRHPGKTPAIKHCTGDLEEFLRKLIEQDPLVTIDIITHRYYGVGGQWVQDTGEYLQMMQGAGIGVKGE